jgi:hypothetical protein
MPFAADAQRLTIIADQASGLDHGIMAAQRSKLIEPAEARSLSSEANRVVRDARRTAAREGGAIPADDYQSLLARLDGVNQKLLYDTGSGFMIGDGADGGTYPNG